MGGGNMGYSIQYAPDLNIKYKAHKSTQINKKRFFILSACLIIVTALFFGKVRNFLWELWIPGDADVTVAAFSEMLADVQQGTSVSKAVQDFCKEILKNE